MAKKSNEFASAGRNAVRLGGIEGEQQQHESDEAKEKPRTREVKWRHGDMEFEAYMRMLDNSVSFIFRIYSFKNKYLTLFCI